jgi:hypothetical protein
MQLDRKVRTRGIDIAGTCADLLAEAREFVRIQSHEHPKIVLLLFLPRVLLTPKENVGRLQVKEKNTVSFVALQVSFELCPHLMGKKKTFVAKLNLGSEQHRRALLSFRPHAENY